MPVNVFISEPDKKNFVIMFSFYAFCHKVLFVLKWALLVVTVFTNDTASHSLWSGIISLF